MQIVAKTLPRSHLAHHGRRKYGRRRSISVLSGRSKSLPWPRGPSPSPYDVLDVKPGEAYSKESFRRLAKLYHPDLHDASTSVTELPRETRLERFHLIIAANQLLSDPRTKVLYDKYGIGWIHSSSRQLDSLHRAHARHDNVGSNGFTPRGRGGHGQDQDRQAYAARPGPPRQIPIYMANSTFAVVLVSLAMACAIFQLKWAKARKGIWSAYINAALHEKTLADLQGIAHRLEGQSREQRVLTFAARRQAGVAHDLEQDGFPSDLGENICRR